MITYRLQLTPQLGFAAARDAAPYLRDLGITHLYLSPILETRRGSTHGYDVTDPTRIREELGGEAEFLALSRAAHDSGLSVLVDIVPNHMAAEPGNPWWRDVLRLGPDSPYASYFDIDWEAGDGKVNLPILGRPLGESVQSGELRLEESEIVYFDRRLPTAPDTARGTLATVLDRQFYRLLDWREGPRRVNYRRFFDIADLVALRADRPEVFKAVHALVLRLVEEGHIDALRVDHTDGLLDPGAYAEELRARLDDLRDNTPPILVEKILATDETIPALWPVQGTTGYEFLNLVNALFVDPAGFDRIDAAARESLGLAAAFEDTAAECKAWAVEHLFPADLERVAVAFERAFDAAAAGDQPTGPELRRSIAALSAALGVYRTYVSSFPPSEEDRERIQDAAARASSPPHPLLLRAILGEEPFESGPRADAALAATQRWQQFTGPLAAKGIEDTALYRDITLVSLNEVGGEPELREDAVEHFHTAIQERADLWPLSLNATATHDTKRGEDTRLRINALSELAGDWLAALARWRDWHAPLRVTLPGGEAPTATDESLFYQSLLGVWPADDGPLDAVADRLTAAMIKSARESKLRTSWHRPDDAYEDALRSYIHAVVLGEAGERFRDDAQPLRRATTFYGAVSSLAQVVIKTLTPGSPDFYQGTELWKTSLVDPDNRRPVDFDERRRILNSLPADPPDSAALRRLLETWPTGAIKLYTIRQALACRRELEADHELDFYEPLRATGPHASRILAFLSGAEDRRCLVVVPRRVAPLVEPGRFPLGEVWRETAISLPESPRAWIDRFTNRTIESGGRLSVAALLAAFPVAALTPAG